MKPFYSGNSVRFINRIMHFIFVITAGVLLTTKDVLSIDCDNVCYKDMNVSYGRLSDHVKYFGEVVSAAKYPSPDVNSIKILLEEFKNLDKDSKQSYLNNINNVTAKLDQCFTSYEHDKQKSKYLLQKLEEVLKTFPDFHNLSKILDEIKEYHKPVVNARKSSQDVAETCKNSESKYDTLSSTVKVLRANFKNILQEYEDLQVNMEALNTELQETYKEGLNNKKDLDYLKIPVAELKRYLDNIYLKFINVTTAWMENSKLIEETLQRLSASKSEKVKSYLSDLAKMLLDTEKNLKFMQNNLTEYEKAIPDVNYVSIIEPNVKKLIKELQIMIEILDKRISIHHAKLDEKRRRIKKEMDEKTASIKNRLKDIKNEKKKLQEYQIFLDTLPQSTEEIESEIWKIQTTLDLIDQKKDLNNKFEDISKICREIDKYKQCPRESVYLEDT